MNNTFTMEIEVRFRDLDAMCESMQVSCDYAQGKSMDVPADLNAKLCAFQKDET